MTEPEPELEPAEPQPYGAPELGPYRRDAGLYASGLTGRYPGLRGSGARDPRIHSTGPGAGAEQSSERSALLAGRIAITATIVIGQLWALTVSLNAWLDGRTGQAAALLVFQLASFALAVAVWRSVPQDR